MLVAVPSPEFEMVKFTYFPLLPTAMLLHEDVRVTVLALAIKAKTATRERSSIAFFCSTMILMVR